ncbi:hypothetical protein KCU93_g4229, partial [Aureobasidium melanogenum]
MDVGSALCTLLLATVLALPLFVFKQYVHGLEILFWIVMWRHYFQEPLEQTTTPQTLPSQEEFLKNFSEPCLQPQRKDDDEEKLAQLSEQELELPLNAIAQNGQTYLLQSVPRRAKQPGHMSNMSNTTLGSQPSSSWQDAQMVLQSQPHILADHRGHIHGQVFSLLVRPSIEIRWCMVSNFLLPEPYEYATGNMGIIADDLVCLDENLV